MIWYLVVMTTTYDLIIIGCGAVGSAAAYYASKQHLKVLCIEQFEQGHARGSSHGETRAFRSVYAEGAHYAPLLEAAYDGWKCLEQEVGASLFVENGVVEFGAENSQWLKSIENHAQQVGLPIEILDQQQVARHTGGIAITDPDCRDDYDFSSEINAITEFFQQHFSLPSANVSEVAHCMYTNTPTEDCIIEQVETGLSVVAGLSGHGYKFSNILGKLAVELALGQELSVMLDQRFRIR